VPVLQIADLPIFYIEDGNNICVAFAKYLVNMKMYLHGILHSLHANTVHIIMLFLSIIALGSIEKFRGKCINIKYAANTVLCTVLNVLCTVQYCKIP